jgi:hypothetical protein
VTIFQVDSFILDENYLDENEQRLEASKFLLAAESDGHGIHTIDPQTQARLEALLEAAGKHFDSICSAPCLSINFFC